MSNLTIIDVCDQDNDCGSSPTGSEIQSTIQTPVWELTQWFLQGQWDFIQTELTPQQVAGLDSDHVYNIIDILLDKDVDTDKIIWTLDLFGADAVKAVVSVNYCLFDKLVNEEYKYLKVLQKLKDMGCLDDSHERLIRRRVMALEDQLTRLFPPSPRKAMSRKFRGVDQRMRFDPTTGLSLPEAKII